MLQKVERLSPNFHGGSLRPGSNHRHKPSCITGLEVAAGFPGPQTALYHPPCPHIKPTVCRRLLPWQGSEGAGPSSRLGVGASEVAHKTPVGLGAFRRSEAALGIHFEEPSPAQAESILVLLRRWVSSSSSPSKHFSKSRVLGTVTDSYQAGRGPTDGGRDP